MNNRGVSSPERLSPIALAKRALPRKWSPRRTWHLAIALATVVVLVGGYYGFYRWWFLPGIQGMGPKLGFVSLSPSGTPTGPVTPVSSRVASTSFSEPPEWTHPIFEPAVWIDYSRHVRKTKRYLEGTWTDSATRLTIEWLRIPNRKSGDSQLDWARCVFEAQDAKLATEYYLPTEYYTWRDRLWKPGPQTPAGSFPPGYSIGPVRIISRTSPVSPARLVCHRMAIGAPGCLSSLTLWPEIWDGDGDPPIPGSWVEIGGEAVLHFPPGGDTLVLHPWPPGTSTPVIAPPCAYALNRDRLILEIHPTATRIFVNSLTQSSVETDDDDARLPDGSIFLSTPQVHTLVLERAKPGITARPKTSPSETAAP